MGSSSASSRRASLYSSGEPHRARARRSKVTRASSAWLRLAAAGQRGSSSGRSMLPSQVSGTRSRGTARPLGPRCSHRAARLLGRLVDAQHGSYRMLSPRAARCSRAAARRRRSQVQLIDSQYSNWPTTFCILACVHHIDIEFVHTNMFPLRNQLFSTHVCTRGKLAKSGR